MPPHHTTTRRVFSNDFGHLPSSFSSASSCESLGSSDYEALSPCEKPLLLFPTLPSLSSVPSLVLSMEPASGFSWPPHQTVDNTMKHEQGYGASSSSSSSSWSPAVKHETLISTTPFTTVSSTSSSTTIALAQPQQRHSPFSYAFTPAAPALHLSAGDIPAFTTFPSFGNGPSSTTTMTASTSPHIANTSSTIASTSSITSSPSNTTNAPSHIVNTSSNSSSPSIATNASSLVANASSNITTTTTTDINAQWKEMLRRRHRRRDQTRHLREATALNRLLTVVLSSDATLRDATGTPTTTITSIAVAAAAAASAAASATAAAPNITSLTSVPSLITTTATSATLPTTSTSPIVSLTASPIPVHSPSSANTTSTSFPHSRSRRRRAVLDRVTTLEEAGRCLVAFRSAILTLRRQIASERRHASSTSSSTSSSSSSISSSSSLPIIRSDVIMAPPQETALLPSPSTFHRATSDPTTTAHAHDHAPSPAQRARSASSSSSPYPPSSTSRTTPPASTEITTATAEALATTFTHSSLVQLLIDPTTCSLVDANRAFYDVTRLQPDTVIGQMCHLTLSAEGDDGVLRPLVAEPEQVLSASSHAAHVAESMSATPPHAESMSTSPHAAHTSLGSAMRLRRSTVRIACRNSAQGAVLHVSNGFSWLVDGQGVAKSHRSLILFTCAPSTVSVSHSS